MGQFSETKAEPYGVDKRLDPEGAGYQWDPGWSSRIPTAIAKAEKLLADAKAIVGVSSWVQEKDVIITATEVQLAQALWEIVRTDAVVVDVEQWLSSEGGPAAEALRAFTEKVESL